MEITRKQRVVIYHIAMGRPDKVIAKKMFICPSTVRKHRRNIYRKLGVNNAAELTQYALANGIVRAKHVKELTGTENPPIDTLTQREKQITRLVINGHTNKQVAKILGVKYSTIRKHRENIYQKRGVNNLAQLTLLSLSKKSFNSRI